MRKSFRFLLVLLFLLSGLLVHARKEGPALLDSLMKALPKTRNDTSQIKLFLSLCIYYELADASKGLPWGMKALELSKKIKSIKWTIISSNEIGNTYGFLGRYSEAVGILEEALKLAKETGDGHLIGMTVNNLGGSYNNVADYPNALKCFLQNLSIAEKQGDPGAMAMGYGNIALVYQNLKKFSEALGYFKRALKIFEDSGATYYVGIALSNIGNTYMSLKDFPKALESFKKALRLETALGNKYLIAQNYCNMGSVYKEMKDYTRAVEYYKKALAIGREIGDEQGTGAYLLNLGSTYKSMATDTVPRVPEKKMVYMFQNEVLLKTAKEYVGKAASIASRIGDPVLEKEALSDLTQICEAQGNYKEALEAFSSLKKIEDSIFSMEKQKQIAGLEAKRENEVKQKEIEVLTEKNSRQKVLIFSALGGLLMLAAIVVIVAVLLRNKRRAHAILQEKDAIIQSDLEKAKEYILSLLPVTTRSEYLSADWMFIPSSKLGGDAFGYHWIDPDHFAFYILDVCGHGVGPALHAVSVMNILNSRSSIAMDLKNPAAVVSGLNEAFQYEEHGGLFFSIWYGVYKRSEGKLTYVNAGHPAPLLVDDQDRVHELGPANVAVGWMPGFRYKSTTVEVPRTSRIILFSDGVYEVDTSDGQTVLLKTFYEFLGNNLDLNLADIHGRLKDHFHAISFPDDYSMLNISFGNH